MKVIVIGAGVIGISTAYFLDRQGHDVTILDSNSDVAQGASRANGAQLSYCYVAPLASPSVLADIPSWIFNRASPVRFRPRLSRDQWQWSFAFLRACSKGQSLVATRQLLSLSLYSRTLLQQVVSSEDLDFNYQQNGKLVVYSSTHSFREASAQVEYQRLFGCEQEVLEGMECVAVEPALRHIRSRIIGGVLTRSDETGDCRDFCVELNRVLSRSPRFRLIRNTEVEGLLRLRRRLIGVDTNHGPMDADAYVVAAGIGSRGILRSVGINLPLYPLKGYSLTVPIHEKAKAPAMSITDHQKKIVYAPLGNMLRIAGIAELGGLDRTIVAARIGDLLDDARATFPHASNYSCIQPWCGLRPATPRSTPFIGPTKYENLMVNVGHGALGFTLAMGAARVVADLVSNNTPEIPLDGMRC